jgi:hypothetical protein
MKAKRRSLRRVIGEAVDLLTKFSVPLYVDDEYGRPDQFGTGFFVRARESHFLVSAAHVLDVARTKGVFFYATPTTLRALNGKVLTTGHPDNRDDDALDVGVMKLTGDALPPYREVEKFAMDISYLTPNYLPRADKHYVIVGFPATKSVVDTQRRTALASPYAYRSDSFDDNDYESLGVNARSHVALPLNLRQGLDSSGEPRIFPKPQGMSGSPIVVLYEATNQNHQRVFPVVAIGVRYRKRQKVLIGTDVRFAVEMIEQFLRS